MKFHPSPEQKLAGIGFALTVIFGFLPFAVQSMDRRIADIGVVAGGAAILYLLRHDALSIWEALPGVPRYVTLHEATTRYHEAMLDTVVGKMAVATTKSPEDVLNWYGFWFVRNGVPIYGSRPPSRRVEEIPAEKLLSGGGFQDGAKSYHRDHDPSGCYTNLLVLKKDFRDKWPHLVADDCRHGISGMNSATDSEF